MSTHLEKMQTEHISQQIRAFESKAVTVGTSYHWFAAHAAVLWIYNADLLYQLRLNFRRDIAGQAIGIPQEAIADLLLGGMSIPVGKGWFEMDPKVRETLLKELKESADFGQTRIIELSDFLLGYLNQAVMQGSEKQIFSDLLRWNALMFVNPAEAAEKLMLAYREGVLSKDLHEPVRIRDIFQKISLPVQGNPDFKNFSHYIRGLAQLALDRRPDAAAEFAQIDMPEVVIGGVRMQVPRVLPKVKRFELPARVIHAALSEDGTLAAAGLENGTVVVCNLSNGKMDAPLEIGSVNASVNSVRFHGQRLLAACSDGLVTVFDLASESKADFLQQFSVAIMTAEFSLDGKFIVLGFVDGRCEIWNVEDGRLHTTLQEKGKSINDAQYHLNKDMVIGAMDRGKLIIWDVQSSRRGPSSNLEAFEIYPLLDIWTFQQHPNGIMYLLGFEKGIVSTFDSSQTIEINRFKAHEGDVRSVSWFFTPEGQSLILSASWDGSVRLFSIEGDLVHEFYAPSGHTGMCVQVLGKKVLIGLGNMIEIYAKTALEAIYQRWIEGKNKPEAPTEQSLPNELKVILLGPPLVGKTTLLQQLGWKGVYTGHPLERIKLHSDTPRASTTTIYKLGDFDDYSGMEQILFDPNSVYVLLIKNKPEWYKEAEQYLRTVPGSFRIKWKVLLILICTEDTSDYAHPEFANIKIVKYNFNTQYGLSTVKDYLAECLQKSPTPKHDGDWGGLLKIVKQSNRGQLLMDFDELCKTALNYKISDPRPFLEYYHNLGEIIWINNHEYLRQVVVTDAEAFSKRVLQFLGSPVLKPLHGMISHAEFNTIMGREYSSKDVDIYFKLSEYFEVIYKLVGMQSDTWQIPKCLPIEPPDQIASDVEMPLFRVYDYEYCAPIVFHRLISRLSPWIKINDKWATGAFIQKNDSIAVILLKDNSIEIRGYGLDPNDLCSQVEKELELIHQGGKFPLIFYKAYPCVCSVCSKLKKPKLYPEYALAELEKQGENNLECPLSKEPVVISDIRNQDLGNPHFKSLIRQFFTFANINYQRLVEIWGERSTEEKVQWLEKGLLVARATCLVFNHSGMAGSGILLEGGYLLTGNHVLNKGSGLSNSKIWLNTQNGTANPLNGATGYELDAENVEESGIGHLNYTRIKIKDNPNHPLETFGFIPIATTPPQKGDQIMLIRFDDQKNIEIDARINTLLNVWHPHLFYTFYEKSPSSGGCPVLNSNWECIGIHEGAKSQEEGGIQIAIKGTRVAARRAKSIHAILEDIANPKPNQLKISSTPSDGTTNAFDLYLKMIEELIVENEIDKAIEALLNLDKKTQAGISDDIIFVTGNYKSASREYRIKQAISFEEYSRYEARARSGLLDLMGDIPIKLERNAKLRGLDTYQFEVPDNVRLEKIIGYQNNILKINWLEKALIASKSVCRVVNGKELGTGFITRDGYLFTNNHVIRRAAEAANARVEFNYKMNIAGQIEKRSVYQLDPSDFISSPPNELDFARIKIIDNPSDPLSQWGYLEFETSSIPLVGEYVTRVQFQLPSGEQAKLTVQTNDVISNWRQYLFYQKDSEPYGSGAPVFNTDWKVVSLHHAGTSIQEGGMTINEKGDRAGASRSILFSQIFDFINRQTGSKTTSPSFRETVRLASPPDTLGVTGPSRWLILYSMPDEVHAKALNKHLAVLRFTKKIQLLDPVKDIRAGESWGTRIQEYIQTADYVLLLTSANLFNDDATYNHVLESLKKGKKIIPILLTPVLLNDTGLEQLPTLPSLNRTISEFSNSDTAWVDVVGELRKIVTITTFDLTNLE